MQQRAVQRVVEGRQVGRRRFCDGHLGQRVVPLVARRRPHCVECRRIERRYLRVHVVDGVVGAHVGQRHLEAHGGRACGEGHVAARSRVRHLGVSRSVAHRHRRGAFVPCAVAVERGLELHCEVDLVGVVLSAEVARSAPAGDDARVRVDVDRTRLRCPLVVHARTHEDLRRCGIGGERERRDTGAGGCAEFGGDHGVVRVLGDELVVAGLAHLTRVAVGVGGVPRGVGRGDALCGREDRDVTEGAAALRGMVQPESAKRRVAVGIALARSRIVRRELHHAEWNCRAGEVVDGADGSTAAARAGKRVHV